MSKLLTAAEISKLLRPFQANTLRSRPSRQELWAAQRRVEGLMQAAANGAAAGAIEQQPQLESRIVYLPGAAQAGAKASKVRAGKLPAAGASLSSRQVPRVAERDAMSLPSSTKEQQALIGVLVSDACCHSSDAIIECERLGLNASHFSEPEGILWREIIKAERELRPFDTVSLCGHLERTRNGDGQRLSNYLTDCAAKNEASTLRGALARIQDYAKTLIKVKAQRDYTSSARSLFRQRRMGVMLAWR